jgi:hypothetical protein
MCICVESGSSAPTLTLPGERERGPTDIGARESMSHLRPDPVDALYTRQSLLPLPLAGEGWGGGYSTANAKL